MGSSHSYSFLRGLVTLSVVLEGIHFNKRLKVTHKAQQSSFLSDVELVSMLYTESYDSDWRGTKLNLFGVMWVKAALIKNFSNFSSSPLIGMHFVHCLLNPTDDLLSWNFYFLSRFELQWVLVRIVQSFDNRFDSFVQPNITQLHNCCHPRIIPNSPWHSLALRIKREQQLCPR